jgi:small subunit ribosomal protein S17
MPDLPLHRRMNGVVVSDKMKQTIVVRVDRTVVHPKYGKRFTVSKRYQADDPQETAKTGEVVTIEACRPISKKKRWRLVYANPKV